MQFLAIVALCIASAIFYGIIHDQITARICVEYFTIGHAPVFGTNGTSFSQEAQSTPPRIEEEWGRPQ